MLGLVSLMRIVLIEHCSIASNLRVRIFVLPVFAAFVFFLSYSIHDVAAFSVTLNGADACTNAPISGTFSYVNTGSYPIIYTCTVNNLMINPSDSLTISNGVVLNVTGTINNTGTITNNGIINSGNTQYNYGTIINFGIINNNLGGTINDRYVMQNSGGTINNSGNMIIDILDNYVNGIFNSQGTITINYILGNLD